MMPYAEELNLIKAATGRRTPIPIQWAFPMEKRMKKLEGKVAVITGATSGMALASAKLFVAEGAYVFITGRRQKELDEAVRAIGNNVTGVQGDAGDLADLDRLYESVKAEKGHFDILYANAGYGEFNVPLGSITEESFDKTFNLNVRGTLFTVQKGLPLLKTEDRSSSPVRSPA